MRTDDVGRWAVLSCYTANLAAYLEGRSSAAEVSDRIARSVRLAVRTDLADGIGFSHHAEPLNRVGDRHLAYRGTDSPDAAAAAMRAELSESGRLLVLAHSAAMPWSVVRPDDDGPHFLLVDGRSGHRWHAVDHFAGLLPSGLEQEPHEGWITEHELLELMRGNGGFSAEQERRNALVFGYPVSVEPARWRWLEAADEPAGELTGQWLHEPRKVWAYLEEQLLENTTAETAPSFLDDLWAASQHHRHRCGHQLRTGTADGDAVRRLEDAWAKLPQSLRFAAESARRGRRRDSLISAAVLSLAEQEDALMCAMTDEPSRE